MNRRTFNQSLFGGAATAIIESKAVGATELLRYSADWYSLSRHTVPDWYSNAKLGIFIHWGLYSVPAWATPSGELGKVAPEEWFRNNPYSEWYLNTLRIEGSPTYEHHVKNYGKNFDYYQFATQFNAAVGQWNPALWADTFRKTGARYVVLTTKHHDGFTLWPTSVKNSKRPGLASKRDIAGELARAVRDHGMKMGLYYSGGLDWTYTSEPIRTMQDLPLRVPQQADYAAYADAHWLELIERYEPSVMWNDIAYPRAGKLEQIFSTFYNKVPDGVVNNRFTVPFSDFTTPEYAKYDRITEKKWESCRGLGFSFGYNQVEGPDQVIAPDKLISLLVDIVSKNGNLLLNVGPRPDGSISEIQLDRLNKLGAWLAVNGEGIFDSRPWVNSGGKSPDGTVIRFTRKADSAYAFVLERNDPMHVTIPGVMAGNGMRVERLGGKIPLEWKQSGVDLMISSKEELPAQFGLRLTPAPSQVVRD